MNILVIGNGFDLAHGLKTSYEDFLNFTQHYLEYDKSYLFSEEVESLIKDNSWLELFYDIQIGKGWVDFEKEISEVIQSLDAVYKIYYDAKRNAEPINYINPYYLEKLEKFGIDYDQLYEDEGINQIKERFLNDLNRLTRCLEIYLSKLIENTGIKYKLNHIDGLRIDHVLSFNYTHTFERVYGEYKRIQYDYIHGKAKEFSDIEECNLILGIDEYLDDLQRDKNTQFIEFKKF